MKKLTSGIVVFLLLFSLYVPAEIKASTKTIKNLTPGDLVTYSDREWVYLQSMAGEPQGLFLRTNSEISRYYYNSGSPIDVNMNFDPNDPLTVANWLNVTSTNWSIRTGFRQ
ncbi:hypothetical protein M3202_00180 [Alkalihalobacillus oceani]|uniref:Uncharacterized protein n=1 Tax=Halalkalibacter oceani TaxID=1653776 RepID=A0A9X2DL17_9BACI|nr:hypothetical protein [Halalkalibacter oceani]MCM3712484.1 hypothetical protein [Halalkalibacter oceani]